MVIILLVSTNSLLDECDTSGLWSLLYAQFYSFLLRGPCSAGRYGTQISPQKVSLSSLSHRICEWGQRSYSDIVWQWLQFPRHCCGDITNLPYLGYILNTDGCSMTKLTMYQRRWKTRAMTTALPTATSSEKTARTRAHLETKNRKI